jgi:hypothetical protein
MSNELRERVEEARNNLVDLRLGLSVCKAVNYKSDQIDSVLCEFLVFLQEQGEPVGEIRKALGPIAPGSSYHAERPYWFHGQPPVGTKLYLHPAPEREREAIVQIARLLVNPNLSNGEIFVRIEHITNAILNAQEE